MSAQRRAPRRPASSGAGSASRAGASGRGGAGPRAVRGADRLGLTEWRPTTPGRLLAWCAAGLAVALVAAAVFGLAVYAAYGFGRDQDGWRDLAAVALGIFGAMAAAAILWLVVVWVGVLRYVSPGRRKVVVLGMLGSALLAFAVLVVGGSVEAAGRSGGWLVWLAALVLLGLPPTLLALRVRSEPRA